MIFKPLAQKGRAIPYPIAKFILIMKLTVILFFASLIQLSAKVNAQNITIQQKNISIKSVLNTIEKQTGYSFFYDNMDINVSRKISIDVINEPLSSVIKYCFQGESVSFKVVQKNILLKKTEPNIESIEYNVPQNVIKGKVVDSSGVPLSGVSIKIEGTKQGTTTQSDGSFLLEASEGSRLEVSYIGYQPREIVVSGNSFFTIVLKQALSVLDQLVIVGYGSQKRGDITGSVSTVSSKELADRPNMEFGYALEGKAAGVQVIRSSGQPQAGFSIRIRGTSSITSGSDPLYIVDGMPTQSIADINPADIESFSILKDAASSAIYGSSGANGVVLITTKHGKNKKDIVSFEVYTGASNVWKKPKVLDASQYKDLMNEMGQSLDWSQYTANTNWADKLFRTAMSQNYQVSVTGGNENTGYYISGGFVKQNGVVISNTVNRANFKVNIDHSIGKIFKIGANISYNRWYDVDVSENSRNGSIMNVILGSPVIGIWNPDKETYTTDPFRNDLDNPVALATGTMHNWTNYRFQGNAYAEAHILPELKFKTMFGYEKFNGIYNFYEDPYKTTEGRGFNGKAEYSENDNQYWISENTLTYTKNFGKHSLEVLGGFVASKTNSSASDIVTHNFANPNITTVNGGSIIDGATATASAVATSSFISRLEYGYAEKYLLTANFRSDASTVFGPKNRWGSFPSFSAGWRISKEDFFNVKSISDLKIRASWGSVGNSQIAPYSYLGIVAPSGSYVIGNKVVSGYLPVTLGNDALKWESTKQTDLGLDLGMFNNRILFTADYYYKKTTGLLLNSPVPASSGYTTALKNVGDLQNKGFDFDLETKNLTGKLKWSSDFNLSINRNKVLNIDGGTIFDGPIDGRANSSIVKAGLPLGSFYGYVAQGVDPQTGNMRYQMADTSVGLQDIDQKVIGNANPKFTYGFTNNLSYGNWSLTVFFQGVQGNDIFDATRIYSEGMWEPRNQSIAVLRRWRTPGQITDIPQEDLTNNTTSQPNYNSLISSRFVENGSYLRLKSLSLGYSFSNNVLKKLKMQSFKIYATAENLLTITKYSGLDPEVSAFGASNTAPGIDFGTYPQTRDIIFGINISF